MSAVQTTPNSSPDPKPKASAPRFGRMDLALDVVTGSIRRASDWLMGQQHPDGFWCGELEADVMLEADYIFMHVLLGTGDPGKMERAINEILRHQNEDGGWSLYPGGPSNINYGVKSYLALKLMGWSAESSGAGEGAAMGCWRTVAWWSATPSPRSTSVQWVSTTMTQSLRFRRRLFSFPTGSTSTSTRSARGRGRSWCRCRSSTRRNRFGSCRPSSPLRSFSLAVARTPTCICAGTWKHIISWRNFFLFTDRLAHWAERVHIRPLRKKALKKAEQWMLDHFERSDGLGAIYPAMLNAIVALIYLGYSKDDPQVIRAMDEFERLGIDWPERNTGLPRADLPHAALFFTRLGYGAGAFDPRRGWAFAHRSTAGEGC